MAIAGALSIRDESGKVALFSGAGARRTRKRSRTWAVLELSEDGYWSAVSWFDHKPETIGAGQKLMREYK